MFDKKEELLDMHIFDDGSMLLQASPKELTETRRVLLFLEVRVIFTIKRIGRKSMYFRKALSLEDESES